MQQVKTGLALVALFALGCSSDKPGESVGSASQQLTAQIPACDDASCCPAGTTPVALTGKADTYNNSATNRCVVAGAGSDTIFASGANNTILAGDGDDTITGGPGAIIRAGAGRDTINGFSGGTVSGGPGDDVVFAGNGNNFVYPGPGLDTVSCGTGDDTVAIYDLCEVVAGEQLVGGTGNNTLITPVPVAQLQAMGVAVAGFQNVLVQQNSCKSDCVTGTQCSGHGACAEGATTGQIACNCQVGFTGSSCETQDLDLHASTPRLMRPCPTARPVTAAANAARGCATVRPRRRSTQACRSCFRTVPLRRACSWARPKT